MDDIDEDNNDNSDTNNEFRHKNQTKKDETINMLQWTKIKLLLATQINWNTFGFNDDDNDDIDNNKNVLSNIIIIFIIIAKKTNNNNTLCWHIMCLKILLD